MKKISTSIIFCLVIYFQISAQDNFKLFGEGVKENVKLLWSVEKWNSSLDGVHFKRRTVDKNGNKSGWEPLNKTIIKIGNKRDKDLSNITNFKYKITQLKELRSRYLNNTDTNKTKIAEISENELKSKLLQKDVLKIIELFFIFDYDIALLYGFAFEDYNMPKAYALEYGLFPVFKGTKKQKPVAVYKWIYGEKPDLSVKIKKQHIKKRKKIVSLKWKIEYDAYSLKKNIAGFNVYRKKNNSEYIKLNPVPIWLDKASSIKTLYYSDTIPDKNIEYKYAAVPVSIFKNEGDKYEITLKANHPDVLPLPVLNTKTESGDDFVKDDVELSWNYEQQYESYISGFIVERRILPNTSFKRISDTLSVSVRKYTDKDIPLKSEANYHYRVTVFPKESYPLWSNTVRLFYKPQLKLPKPVKLKAIPEIIGDDVIVHLSWEENKEALTNFEGYAVYCDLSGGILAYEADIPPIKASKYDYLIEGVTGTEYLFSLGIADKNNDVKPISDTVSVIIPSESLPFINIWPFSVNDRQITINWKYDNDIPDLTGFRIYLNEVLVADESDVGKLQRTWSTKILEPGKYNLEIEAVTSYGVISERSDKRVFGIKE